MSYKSSTGPKRGRSLFLALGLLGLTALLALGGWQYWQHQKVSQGEEASTIYEDMLAAVKQNEAKRAEREAQRLVEQFPTTPYGDLAAMLLARINIEKKDIPAAVENLRSVIAKGDNTPLAHIAKVRVARLLASEGQFQEALDLLETEKTPGGFTALYEEAKGDIYAKLNQPDKARIAYQTAIKAAPPGISSPVIPMKASDLTETQTN